MFEDSADIEECLEGDLPQRSFCYVSDLEAPTKVFSVFSKGAVPTLLNLEEIQFFTMEAC